MSQSVNISACPFHRYIHKYWPLSPHRCAADHSGLPSRHRASPAAQLPTYISSWKRSRWPHDLLFEEDLVETQSRPSSIQFHPRETCRICWTLLEWHSVSLRALVKIHLQVSVQLESTDVLEFKLLLRLTDGSSFSKLISSMILGKTKKKKTWLHPAQETIKRCFLFTRLWEIKCTLRVRPPRLRRLSWAARK